jgi:hypothetical protein
MAENDSCGSEAVAACCHRFEFAARNTADHAARTFCVRLG